MSERRRTAAVALAAAALAALFGLTAPGRLANEAIYDQLSTRLAPGPAPAAVIVAIDEPSFADLGLPWPWPREVHARLVASLRAAGARAVAFDVLFVDPTASDAALASAMGPDVVIAADVETIETPQGALTVRVEPLPLLTAAGARRGLVGMPLDDDGAVRRLPPLADGFAARTLAALDVAPPQPPDNARIAFPGPPGAYPRVSFYQALNAAEMLPPGLFEGRVAFVGLALRASADVTTGGADLFRTPWTARGFGLTPGVEIHALAFDTLREAKWIAPVPVFAAPALALLAAFGAAFAARGRGVAAATLATAGGAIAWIGAAATGLAASVWLPPAAPALAALLAGAAQAGLDLARERAARRRVLRAFEHYLAPAMVERLAEDPGALRLGGELRHVTLFFCDLRGFTTLTEAMKADPEGLTRLVNRALTPVVKAIHAHDGAVDKFMGDCVMGLWNAPLETPGHPRRAVAAAIAAVDAVARLSEDVDREAEAAGRRPPRLGVGVGVNTGTCVVGNMGADGRFDYPALGDAVNLAARLEGLTRSYGVDCLVGEETAEEAGFEGLAEVDLVAVKGKAEPVRAFVPLALWADPVDWPIISARVAAALAAWRRRDWAAAREGFASLAAGTPAAAAYAAIMTERTYAAEADPPPPDWNGVWVALTK